MYICNPAHRVSRPRGTGSVGDSVGEGQVLHHECSALRKGKGVEWLDWPCVKCLSLVAVRQVFVARAAPV